MHDFCKWRAAFDTTETSCLWPWRVTEWKSRQKSPRVQAPFSLCTTYMATTDAYRGQVLSYLPKFELPLNLWTALELVNCPWIGHFVLWLPTQKRISAVSPLFEATLGWDESHRTWLRYLQLWEIHLSHHQRRCILELYYTDVVFFHTPKPRGSNGISRLRMTVVAWLSSVACWIRFICRARLWWSY